MLELETEAGYDFLVVYESATKETPLQQLSGSNDESRLNIYTSSAGTMHLAFSSDSSAAQSASCRVTLCVPIALFAALPAKNGSPERTR